MIALKVQSPSFLFMNLLRNRRHMFFHCTKFLIYVATQYNVLAFCWNENKEGREDQSIIIAAKRKTWSVKYARSLFQMSLSQTVGLSALSLQCACSEDCRRPKIENQFQWGCDYITSNKFVYHINYCNKIQQMQEKLLYRNESRRDCLFANTAAKCQ